MAPPALKLDVIVLGAGIAGVAAARRLAAAGRAVLLLEARARVGGRAYTDETQFGLPLDLGAAWVHAWDVNPLTPVLRQHGLTLGADQELSLFVGGRAATPAELAAFERTYEAFEDAWEELAWARGADVAAPAVTPAGLPFAELVTQLWGPLEFGVEYAEVSALEAAALRGGVDRLVPGGLGTLVQRLAAGLEVRLGTPASRVRYGDSGVEVLTEAGERFGARRLITTVSNGVLAAGGLRFDPALPDGKLRAIAGLPMGRLEKVVLELDDDTPLRAVPAGTWVQHDAPEARAVGLLVRPGGAPLVVAVVGGVTAARLAAEGEAAAVRWVQRRLAEIFGDGAAQRLRRGHMTTWWDDPYIRGAYSAARPGAAHLRVELARPVADRLFFAGEAVGDAPETMATPQAARAAASARRHNWAVMLPGAYLSGLRAAEEVLASLGRQSP